MYFIELHLKCSKDLNNNIDFTEFHSKLDGVGPIDNRPFTD